MNSLIPWLLEGDVAIQYQTYRDLMDTPRPDLQERIATEGWGAQFLSLRNENGHWGREFYFPKWTSSHYTLLDLKHLAIAPNIREIQETIADILDKDICIDGGIYPHGGKRLSDVCLNGMFLNYASYYKADAQKLQSVVDSTLGQQMPDGGFNCMHNRKGARHSSLHSTLSVCEGIREYQIQGYSYRLNELLQMEKDSQEFILQHRLYKSDKTGEVIKKQFTMLSYPSRWYYDILRALEYFRVAQVTYNERMADGLELLQLKRRSDGTWPVQHKHSGAVHFDMEKTGGASRWNTLRALRVLKYYGIES